MKTLRHPVASIVIFAMLISLVLVSYNNLRDSYSFARDQDSLINNQSIAERFNSLTLISSLNSTISSIYELSSPTANTFDVLGSLAATGLGVLKVIGGLIIYPIEILNILYDYYPIPTIMIGGLSLLITIYVGFILLSAYLRSDV